MVVVVDTCSLHRLVVYYLPFDKDGLLLSLLEKQFTSGQMMMTDLVYSECQYMDKGVILERLPFLKNAEFKKGLIKTEGLVPKGGVLRQAPSRLHGAAESAMEPAARPGIWTETSSIFYRFLLSTYHARED